MARVLEEDDTEAIQRLCELGVSEETLLRAGAAAKTVNRHFKRSGSRHTMNKGGRKMRWVSVWTPSAAHSVPHLHSRVRRSHIEPLALRAAASRASTCLRRLRWGAWRAYPCGRPKTDKSRQRRRAKRSDLCAPEPHRHKILSTYITLIHQRSPLHGHMSLMNIHISGWCVRTA